MDKLIQKKELTDVPVASGLEDMKKPKTHTRNMHHLGPYVFSDQRFETDIGRQSPRGHGELLNELPKSKQ